jgi:heptosyltransferase III
MQRSNGDVLLSQSLIENLYKHYEAPSIDLIVNDDTVNVARLLNNINKIHEFSYTQKKNNRWKQESKIIRSIFRRYDLSINLTSSDRSIIYALLSARKSISAVESENRKSWWKKTLLSDYYYFDSSKHILLNNLESLNLLQIKHENVLMAPFISKYTKDKVSDFLKQKKIRDFIIFHPSAQYQYKIYPKHLRDELLLNLATIGIPIIVTGGSTEIDIEIKQNLPSMSNLFDFIGETSLEEYFALSSLAAAYVGMDTLNMHIAAAQEKKIFAIFGPTKLSMWAPWSNIIKKGTNLDNPLQTYGNVTIFQASLPCVACGNAGCDDNHGKSLCLDQINPSVIFSEISSWYENDFQIMS